MNLEIFDVGSFEVISGILVVSDPCYELGTWCQGQILDVKNGQWNARVGISDEGQWGLRVAYLEAFHASVTDRTRLDSVDAPFEVGVDSGQAGIFDRQHFRDDAVITAPAKDPLTGEIWYDACCEQTLHSDHQAGVIPFGAVSSSGYGDGGYDCKFFCRGSGKGFETVGVLIDFDLVEKEKLMCKICAK